MFTNPNLIYVNRFVFCSIPRMFVCLRLRMSSSQKYANVYVKSIFLYPVSIAGVPFDSVRRFRPTLLLHTTCVRSCCTWRASCVAVFNQKKNEILSHPTRKTHCKMNEISRKFPEPKNGNCKEYEERDGRRGCQSDTAQVRWVMAAETPGQYRCQTVCCSIFHTMYTVTERLGRKLCWVVWVWLFCDVLHPNAKIFTHVSEKSYTPVNPVLSFPGLKPDHIKSRECLLSKKKKPSKQYCRTAPEPGYLRVPPVLRLHLFSFQLYSAR